MERGVADCQPGKIEVVHAAQSHQAGAAIFIGAIAFDAFRNSRFGLMLCQNTVCANFIGITGPVLRQFIAHFIDNCGLAAAFDAPGPAVAVNRTLTDEANIAKRPGRRLALIVRFQHVN